MAECEEVGCDLECFVENGGNDQRARQGYIGRILD